jgi:hypothetical protein
MDSDWMQKVLMKLPLLLLVLRDYHPSGGLASMQWWSTELFLRQFLLGLPQKMHLLAHLLAQASSSNPLSEALCWVPHGVPSTQA